MCGIVGYSSTSNSIELSKFVSMIKSLDYRGYDSWGFTFKDEDQLKTKRQYMATAHLLKAMYYFSILDYPIKK